MWHDSVTSPALERSGHIGNQRQRPRPRSAAPTGAWTRRTPHGPRACARGYLPSPLSGLAEAARPFLARGLYGAVRASAPIPLRDTDCGAQVRATRRPRASGNSSSTPVCSTTAAGVPDALIKKMRDRPTGRSRPPRPLRANRNRGTDSPERNHLLDSGSEPLDRTSRKLRADCDFVWRTPFISPHQGGKEGGPPDTQGGRMLWPSGGVRPGS